MAKVFRIIGELAAKAKGQALWITGLLDRRPAGGFAVGAFAGGVEGEYCQANCIAGVEAGHGGGLGRDGRDQGVAAVDLVSGHLLVRWVSS